MCVLLKEGGREEEEKKGGREGKKDRDQERERASEEAHRPQTGTGGGQLEEVRRKPATIGNSGTVDAETPRMWRARSQILGTNKGTQEKLAACWLGL